MSVVKVKLDKKTHQLKFGYGVFKTLGSIYKVQGFQGVGDYISGLNLGDGELTFDQIDFFGNLIFAALPDEAKDAINCDVNLIIDEVVLKTPEKLEEIMLAFSDSMPKSESKGKPNPATRKKK